MWKLAFICFVFFLTPTLAIAQRDPPVWESYLASQSIYHEPGGSVTLELLFKKEGGPVGHTQQQIYVLAYLKNDEGKIFALASDVSLLDKSKPDKPMLLDVLLEKKLVTILESKVAKRSFGGAQDVAGKYGFEAEYLRGKDSLKLNTFPFNFSFANKSLFEAVSKLGNFDPKRATQSDNLYFDDRFKLLVFAPVNDCKYADKILPDENDKHDFANYTSNIFDPSEPFLYHKTPLLYFKPLEYEFQLKKLDPERYIIYIN